MTIVKPSTNLIRSFVGIPITETDVPRCEAMVEALRCSLNPGLVRWVPAANLHITLAFLGLQSKQDLSLLVNQLTSGLDQHSAFSLTGKQLSSFPDAKSRVLALQFEPNSALLDLRGVVLEAILKASIRLPHAERRFRPHLTLGRIRSRTENIAWEQKVDNRFVAQSVVLFESVTEPEGVVYRQRAQFELR